MEGEYVQMKEIKDCIKIKENVFYNKTKKRYYIKTECPYCGEVCYNGRSNYKKYNVGYCDKSCRAKHTYVVKEPKTVGIMNMQDDCNFYYLVGLITTDGHIWWPGCTKSSRRFGVAIELHEKDKELLDKLVSYFGGKLTHNKKTHCIKWSIFNENFVKYLRNIGLTNNKSVSLMLNKEWFYKLTETHRNHFLRGVVDGDGCVHIGEKSKYISICSYAENFRNLLFVYFKDCGYVCFCKPPRNEILFFGRNGIKPFMNIFTNNQNYIYMQRKYDKFKRLCLHYADQNEYRGVKITQKDISTLT